MSLEDFTQWPPPVAPPPGTPNINISAGAPPAAPAGDVSSDAPPQLPAAQPSQQGTLDPQLHPSHGDVQSQVTTGEMPQQITAAATGASSMGTLGAHAEQAKEQLRLRMKVAALEVEVIRLNAKLRAQEYQAKGMRPPATSLLLGRNAAEKRPLPGSIPTSFMMSADGLSASLRVDPIVATEIRTLRERLHSTESTLKQLQDDWKVMTTFNADGPVGVRLLEKCRKLLKENEVLGEALMIAKVAATEQQAVSQTEREAFLLHHLKLLYEFNADLESECSSLVATINQLAVTNQGLRAENSRLESELHTQQRDRSVPRGAAGGPVGGGGGGGVRPAGRSPPRRERSPSAERRRRSSRRTRE